MRCPDRVLLALALLTLPVALPAQSAQDTLPARVVARMLELFDRGDIRIRSMLYDSAYYLGELDAPAPGAPERPAPTAAEARTRAWGPPGAPGDPGLPRHRKMLQRLVAGPFVVYHVAVVFDPPHERHSFEKLEIYEVRNGRIVAEYDGRVR